jgi:pimeloyl-ACP methyl ester carboxylesterase
MLHLGAGTAAALGASVLSGELSALAQAAKPSQPLVPAGPGVQLFYRDDSIGDPWRNPEPVMLIHGVGESGITWFGWMPRMSREYRVLRPDLPGFGNSPVPQNFDWKIENVAAVLARFLDAVGVDSAHVMGAKLGGAIAMQFAADFPRRTRTLVLASAPVTEPKFPNTPAKVLEPKWVADTQRDRLGSAASDQEV